MISQDEPGLKSVQDEIKARGRGGRVICAACDFLQGKPSTCRRKTNASAQKFVRGLCVCLCGCISHETFETKKMCFKNASAVCVYVCARAYVLSNYVKNVN